MEEEKGHAPTPRPSGESGAAARTCRRRWCRSCSASARSRRIL
uniref:Uncharacterized protein n=1 Tax=Arundo donax TaxID=35708 RepID=A0A0A9D4L1_ARUDO